MIAGLMGVSRRAGWLLALVLATAVGLFSLRYLLGRVEWAPPDLRPSFQLQPAVFITHAVAASIALLAAPWQILSGVRRRWPATHRNLGRVYAAGVVVAGLAAFPMAARSFAGPIAGGGFASLAALWLTCTVQGVAAARARRLEDHRRWMLRSLALTFAAVTLRAYLPVPPLLGWTFTDGYRLIAWACWVPNLLLVELWLRRRAFSAQRRRRPVTALAGDAPKS